MKKYLLFAIVPFFIVGCGSTKEDIQKVSNNDRNYKIYNGSKKAAVVSSDFLTENALHDAVRANDLELVEFLLTQGVKKDQQDEYGYTPLHLAVRLHNLEIVQLLLSNGVNPNTMDKFKDTPLLDSTRNNDTEISKELICHGAKRNVADMHDMSTLHNSSKNNNKYISELLRADHVEPYCQEELEIDIEGVAKNELCGNILKGFATGVSVSMENGNGEFFGEYEAKVDNISHRWCIDLSSKDLKDDLYNVNALGVDYVVNEAEAAKSIDIGTDKIGIDITDPVAKQKPNICGDILRGNIDKVDVTLMDKNSKSYGKYESIVYVDQKRWCAQVDDKLPFGTYDISAVGHNDEGQEIKASGGIEILEPLNELEIALDEYNKPLGSMPKICGDVKLGEVETLDLILNRDKKSYGPFKGSIKDDRWCAKVSTELPNGRYDVTAKGYNSFDKVSIDNGDIQVYVIPGLYEALKKEFVEDFEPWQAELDKDTLTWRFKNPAVLFELGKKDLRDQFKTILDDFYPRYIKVLKEYMIEIENIAVEGHSSSEHRSGKSIDEKYLLNLDLSQKRANEVLEYAKASSDPVIMGNIVWILNTFYAKGYSSSKLVYNEDGTENKELSRRVEFRIETRLKEEGI